MIGKIRLTQEQAEAIKCFLENHNGDTASVIDVHASFYKRSYWSDVYKPLNDLPPSDLARALLVGYEVELDFEVGDWVKVTHEEAGVHIGKILEITERQDGDLWIKAAWNYQHSANYAPLELAVKCSEEEVADMKEKRFWSHKIRREVGEFKHGDVLADKYGNILPAFEVDAKEMYERGELRGFFPIDSLIKFGGDE